MAGEKSGSAAQNFDVTRMRIKVAFGELMSGPTCGFGWELDDVFGVTRASQSDLQSDHRNQKKNGFCCNS